jgi:GntR family transcriptional regulator, transcriptional repressor for pyruvate dehydrogenase complex
MWLFGATPSATGAIDDYLAATAPPGIAVPLPAELEVESAGSAALHRTEQDVLELRAVLDDAVPAIEAHDHQTAMDKDLEFHRRLSDITDNPILRALIEALARPTLRMRMWQSMHRVGRLATTHQEHTAILEAVAAGDAVAARAAMYTHLAQVAAHLEQ